MTWEISVIDIGGTLVGMTETTEPTLPHVASFVDMNPQTIIKASPTAGAPGRGEMTKIAPEEV